MGYREPQLKIFLPDDRLVDVGCKVIYEHKCLNVNQLDMI